MINVANSFTILRIVLIPALVFAFYIPGIVSNVVVATLFAVAAITDFFDGYFARLMKLQSKFGKCLDPIADKLLVIVAIVMLISYSNRNLWILIPGLIIICREVLVSGLREFLAELHLHIPVTTLSKYKTGFQMTAITMLLLGEKGSTYTVDHLSFGLLEIDIRHSIVSLIDLLGKILFMTSAVLTVITGYIYWQLGIKNM